MAKKVKDGQVYVTLFLVAFFGFFRLASLVTTSVHVYDKSRLPTVGDKIFGQLGIHIVMKHAKNMQSASQHQVVQLPLLQDPLICPVRALKALLKYIPHHPDDPLFVLKFGETIKYLTTYKVRLVLASLVKSMGLHPTDFGFHTFRRSGASLAFNNKVPLENIQAHGNWKSNAIRAYLSNTPQAASVVSRAFQKSIKTK